MESIGFVGRFATGGGRASPGAAALALSRHVAAQSPQDVQQLADQAIRRLDLQTTFPRSCRS